MQTYQNHLTDSHTSYDIFVGNDVYGRGTYAGGRLDTWKAINEIQKYPLSVSIFG